MNEAWVLQDAPAVAAPSTISQIKTHIEYYANEKRKAVWSSGRANDGRILLEGPDKFFYSSGQVQWSLNFHLGKRTGEEIYYRADGSKAWQKTYVADGTWPWRVFDQLGAQTAESQWHGKTLVSWK